MQREEHHHHLDLELGVFCLRFVHPSRKRSRPSTEKAHKCGVDFAVVLLLSALCFLHFCVCSSKRCKFQRKIHGTMQLKQPKATKAKGKMLSDEKEKKIASKTSYVEMLQMIMKKKIKKDGKLERSRGGGVKEAVCIPESREIVRRLAGGGVGSA